MRAINVDRSTSIDRCSLRLARAHRKCIKFLSSCATGGGGAFSVFRENIQTSLKAQHALFKYVAREATDKRVFRKPLGQLELSTTPAGGGVDEPETKGEIGM